jgi:hypothetical protein
MKRQANPNGPISNQRTQEKDVRCDEMRKRDDSIKLWPGQVIKCLINDGEKVRRVGEIEPLLCDCRPDEK